MAIVKLPRSLIFKHGGSPVGIAAPDNLRIVD